jgi:diguanylate cyclase (GGDEF)-like protein/PAS domain S-box-containing protein
MTDLNIELQSDGAVYKTLLESTKAIPWRIDWKTMTFSYIGPQIEALLGWAPSSWVGVNDWVERMHPEDREYVVDFCVSQSQAGVDHEADYRALTKTGDYVWIRDVVHVVRNNGEVEALVGFMFDISERKKNEEQLLRLQRELEDLSFKDGLTGVANRRRFDSALEQEWASAQRTGEPLSMILLDIDFFKQYNDGYGHLLGDDCLRQIAGCLAQAANRPRDVFARIGGEEFAWLLPDTHEPAALRVAEQCRRLVHDLRIPHKASTVSPSVTLSLGVATARPGQQAQARSLIGFVDDLLYRAKGLGRDRAEFGRWAE